MSIFVDESTRVLVQGITGWQGKRNTADMLAYGTSIVAGVSPGKGGESVDGVPVYDTVEQALADHDVDASLVSVPPLYAEDAVLEAVAEGIDRIVALPEGVPTHDACRFVSQCREAGVTLVGPNSQGVISPGKAKIGGSGGDRPERQFVEGNVGIISRSGGMGAETAWLLKEHGMGVSTYLSIGGDSMIGSSFRDLLEMFEDDDETEAVVLFGEVGTSYEEEAAEYIERHVSKPVVAIVAGQFVEEMPQGVSFGHAGAVIRGSTGQPSDKIRRLREAGVHMAENHEDIPEMVERALDS
jgi:succinyl-CoA synthetase alpha subunit